ncbi:helix-turn-helix domain-containing protein [Arthrobacter sp. JSM 101049]|uniref:helix-turn-helix domain-containing protein n=1 Tax=Arthrobacter sp. JSM 101049 TaxID=929097 RepID=UPI0035630792
MSTIKVAKAAQDRLVAANQKFIHVAAERDAALKAARQAGVSAQELAARLGLSRQQVHKIIRVA